MSRIEEMEETVPVYKEMLEQHYRWKGFLARGGCGDVQTAIDLRTNEIVAIKRVPTIRTHPGALKSEIRNARAVSHKNLVRTLAIYETKNTVYFVMEKYPGGDLFDAVVNQPKSRYEDEVVTANIVRQVLEGLAYLHENGIAHCDLKPANIMFAADGSVKIIDLGLSQNIESDSMFTDACGSAGFMAPEIFHDAYNELCDLWALGIITFIMLFGFNPFDPRASFDRSKVKSRILKGFRAEIGANFGAWFPEAYPVSAEARDFIAHLLVADWKHRMTAVEALKHSWITRET
jgi:calcium/calmodulin-dependent protein kinase-4